jgi:hypothetical protein
MERAYRVAAALCIAGLVAGCSHLTSPDGGGDGGSGSARNSKSITTSAQAQTLFTLLRSSGDAVDRQVSTNFNGATSVVGSTGKASVTGKKTSSSTSSSSSSSTTRSTDLQIAFSDFRSSGSTLTVSGSMRWFDNYYSRTACSSTTCASSSDHSESMTGSSIHVEFQSSGEAYSDDIQLEATSPSYTSRWTVKITNRAGQVFSFSY